MLRFDTPHSSTTFNLHTPVARRRGDLTIHFTEVLSQDEQQEIITALTCRQGVEKVKFQPNHPHLAIVYYDVFMTSSKKIMECINGMCLLPKHLDYIKRPALQARMFGI